MELGIYPVVFPKTFSIGCSDPDTDYTACAHDIAIDVKLVYRTNRVIHALGREVLTGWAEAAAVTCTFFVSAPRDEECAKKAVKASIQEISRTVRAFMAAPEHLRPIIVNVPIGCRVIGSLEVVQKSRPRDCAYIADFIGSIHDAFRRNIEYMTAYFETHNAPV
jgi:hypothetical protein